MALAASDGFTALEYGKKLVSDDIEVVDVVRFAVGVGRGALGSMPKRTVPELWATPASGICWPSTGERRIVC